MNNTKKCALCGKKDADKKNTHYLTDSIIRSCFDIEGRSSNKYREKGVYFDVSSNILSMRFGFQRSTSDRILFDKLGRMPTEEENEEALKNPYSVDYVFCSDCEDIFSEIEKPFIENVLPKVERYNKQHSDVMEISDINEIRTIWLFFLLQYWRSCVCDPNISFNEDIAENLRMIILHHKVVEIDELINYPLTLSYIKTSEPKNHTNHFVGFFTGRNPYVILMNDFIVQLFDSKSNVEFCSLYGINDENTFNNFVNYGQELFKVGIVSEDRWNMFSLKYYNEEKVPKIEAFFICACCRLIRHAPSEREIVSFRKFLGEETNPFNITDELLRKLICQFIIKTYPLLLALYNPNSIIRSN